MQAAERVWGEPAPCQTVAGSSHRCLGDPAPARWCWQRWSRLLPLSVPVSPRPWRVAAAAPSVCAVYLSLAFPRQRLCRGSSADPLLPTWSPWQLAAGVGVLQVSLGCSAGSGVGWLQALEDSSAAHVENTRSNHKEWRWCLKKKKKYNPQKKVICRGLQHGDTEAASCHFCWGCV